MTEKDNVSNILENYADKERLALILRLNKDGHITEEEALNLLMNDRNYFLTNTIHEIKEAIKQQSQPYWSIPATWTSTNTGPFYGGLTSGSGTITVGGSIYSGAASNP